MNPLKRWRVKGLIQKTLSMAPGGVHANDFLQKRLGGLKRFDENIAAKVGDWIGIVELLRKASPRDLRGSTVLEIGSGWYPTLPICFSLCGVKKITTVDLQLHMDAPLTFRALRSLSTHLERIARAANVPTASVRQRYDALSATRSLSELLDVARIEYHAPADATRLTSLPDASLDVVYSNSVLEHVPRSVIAAMMTETFRILSNDGYMIHAVACNDHYAHFDRSISFVNFLSFDEVQWKTWNNSLQFQNRMRAPEFLEIASACGFRVLHEARAVRPGTREALAKMRVSPEFAHFSVEDLAATTVDFVAKKELQPAQTAK